MDANILHFVQQMMMQNPDTVPNEVKEPVNSSSAPANMPGPNQEAWTDTETSEYLNCSYCCNIDILHVVTTLYVFCVWHSYHLTLSECNSLNLHCTHYCNMLHCLFRASAKSRKGVAVEN